MSIVLAPTHFFFFFLMYFLAAPHSLQVISFPKRRIEPRALRSESAES